MGQVGGVQGEFDVEPVGDMDMGEDPFFTEFADSFMHDGVDDSRAFEDCLNGFQSIREKMDIDIGTAAHVTGQDTADQPRAKRAARARSDARALRCALREGFGAAVAFVEFAAKMLDLVADFRITHWEGLSVSPSRGRCALRARNLARKYSDSWRSYMQLVRSLSNAICRRNLSLFIRGVPRLSSIRAARRALRNYRETKRGRLVPQVAIELSRNALFC